MSTRIIKPATGKVSGTLTNFPVFINPTVMTGWATLSLAEAQSLRFYTSASHVTEMPREVVSATEIYVLVPSLTETTEIHCEYDGVASDYAVGDTYGRNAVWSNYEGVYHLASVTDHTGNGYTLTNGGTVTFVSALLGNGANFTPSQSLDNTGLLGITSYPKTFSVIANFDVISTDQVIFSLKSGVNDYYTLKLRGADNHLVFRSNNSSQAGDVDTGITVTVGTNYHCMVVQTSTTSVDIYINGVKTNSASTTYISGNTDFYLGYLGRSSVWYFDGKLDEVRVSNGAKNQDWATTEYNNHSSIATFWGSVINDSFTNPANIYVSDNTYTTITTAETTVYVSVSKDAGVTFSDELSKTLTSSDTVVSFGTTPASEVWGLNWTRADLVNSLFRVKVRVGNNQQIYKTFGFTTGTETVYGIEINIEGKATGGTVSLDYLEVKVHYGNTLLPIEDGSQIFVTDGRKAGEGVGAGTGVLAFYDGTSWIAVDTGVTVDD